jgi:hypothetical protein
MDTNEILAYVVGGIFILCGLYAFWGILSSGDKAYSTDDKYMFGSTGILLLVVGMIIVILVPKESKNDPEKKSRTTPVT